ncbi:MAG: hypothetical protein A3B10_04280 [Candidatus Doudnabacteria bacterium RIFCSPLOWO2_01_FULL_44_21]|uniref:Uncharacterized protein n=1 Tax=Candidatus Doudnabacteria bacterium RIFCSPLOWO2_01_FULL_44_21 TaxID=1817841 RepID=A0A1F5PXN2_9BACT|nr:MAG: hypothetical protein A3B95_01235 [Candidatus Doudnabacteria bacterium RIFCSPHIGHO2_02_FULL_43_13b]OGE94701.1 MAG: hypothetical protein A3B10_04280 [Candidatus Doudnabacteria bacterium RIFCSPLOWO2_01_FULL_44_21]
MHSKAIFLFNAISIFVLAATLFVLQPSKSQEILEFKTIITKQVSIAWQQTWADNPFLQEFGQVFEGVEEFYAQAATTLAGFLQDKESDQAIGYMLQSTYAKFALALTLNSKPLVAGEAVVDPFLALDEAKNQAIMKTQWTTITDMITGQDYCLAIFNGEVNKYLGACYAGYR